jgi:hypothetical protein
MPILFEGHKFLPTALSTNGIQKVGICGIPASLFIFLKKKEVLWGRVDSSWFLVHSS